MSAWTKVIWKQSCSIFEGFPWSVQYGKKIVYIVNWLNSYYSPPHLILLLFFFFLLRVFFYISVSWYFYTGVWVTANYLKSSGFFSVLWPISIMLEFRWSLLTLLFPNPPVPTLTLWWLYRAQQLQLVSTSLSCRIGFFPVLLQGLGTYISFRFLSVIPCVQPERQIPLFGWFSFFFSVFFFFFFFFFFCWLSINLVVWPRFSDLSLADGLSLELEWQQVSSSLQDSSQYSSRFQ